jgi:hypothetical protein
MAYAFDKGMKLADTGCRVLDLKSEIIDAAKSKAKTARKVMLKARYTAEEFVDTATLAVKKHPMKAVCYTFGAAFAFGALAGWLAKRNG